MTTYEVNNSAAVWEALNREGATPHCVLEEGSSRMLVEVEEEHEADFEDLIASVDSDWKVV